MSLTKTETHELSVGTAPRLIVRNTAGTVAVQPGADGHVRVVVTKKVRGGLGAASERDLEQVVVHVTQEGDTISVETETTRWPISLKSVTIDIAITVPATCAQLEARLSAGNLVVRGLTTTLAAIVNAGNLDALGVTLRGGSDLALNAGNLTMDGALAPGATLDARLNAGNARFTLPRDTPAQLDARTTVGQISVSGWQVLTERQIVQQRARGALGAEPTGSLRIHVDAGNLTLLAR
ncbi:MAG TPA: hypothetical protein VE258_17545 [Ktedonobacterales bacterium]|nr:hypothetical protein [Ktedonobacterales bacterium]